jgi:hypothetical protein
MLFRLNLCILALSLGLSGNVQAQEIPDLAIRQVRTLNDDGDASAFEATLVRLSGVSTTGGRQFAPTSRCDNPPCTPGVGFYIDDGEAAIFVWSYIPSAGIENVEIGQRLRVSGLVRTFKGRLMLTDFIDPACQGENPPEGCDDGSLRRLAPIIEVIDAQAEVPAPLQMTLQGFMDLGDQAEGRLIAIAAVFSDDLSQRLPRSGTDGSFQLHDSSVLPGEVPVSLYVEKTTDISGETWPERSQADIVVIADQYFNGGGAPGDRGRRLRARSWADFTNFRPREDEQWPQQRVDIASLRPVDGLAHGEFEGQRVWIEGWLTTEHTTFRESRTGGVGFAMQDDSGGVIVRSSAVDHVWGPAAEGAPTCQSNTECAEGERCGPRSLCQAVVEFADLRSGVRVRALGRVNTHRGRLLLTDARLDDPLLIEVLGAGGEGEPAERVFAPVEVTTGELLRGGEQYEGTLVIVKELHLADVNQDLPRAGQNGRFSLGDEENLRLGVHVERFACQDDDGAKLCVNRSTMSLPPETFSGNEQWDLFKFDLTGVADEIREGGGAGERGIMPRFPDDFSNFQDRRPAGDVPDAGPGGQPQPPRGSGGCACGASGVEGLMFLLLPFLRRRRSSACAKP